MPAGKPAAFGLTLLVAALLGNPPASAAQTVPGTAQPTAGQVIGTAQNTAAAPGTAPAATLPMTVLGRAAGLIGVFATLVILGFGVVTFGRPNLEIVSDTVAVSFGRSFLVRMLGQILLLPT